MPIPLIKKFWSGRRAATAMVMAIIFVPLVIAAGSAVDFARIASARALLQNSVDTAAIAGVGGYQTSIAYTTAIDVASATYYGTGVQLPNFVTAAGAPSIGAYCYPGAANAKPCDTGASTTGALSSLCPSTWDTSESANYCVVVTQTVTLKNSLLAFIIPSELLSARGVATADFPQDTINNHDINPNANSFVGGDANNAYIGPVPPTGAGGTPNFSSLQPFSGCGNVPGLSNLPGATAPTPSTPCQYIFIANTSGDVVPLGSFNVGPDQPIQFLFVNDTGENGYYSTDSTHYTTNLMISTTSPSNGYSYYPTGYGATTCKHHQANCTPTNANTVYGLCPNHTLYGSLSPDTGAPASDSINIYSSGYEVLGYPPTQFTNHPLTPFISTDVVTTKVGNSTFYARAICPNYSLASTAISAPLASSYSSILDPSGASDFSGVNVFSTWYPAVATNDAVYTDSAASPAEDSSGHALTTGNGDIFPPGIAGCTAAYNATDGGITSAFRDPWWNWTLSKTNYNNCGNTTTPQSTGAASYLDCALLIQPLGTAVPTITPTTGTNAGRNVAQLPNYYLMIEDASGTVLALDPIWDNTGVTNNQFFVDLYPGTTSGSFPGTAIAAMTAYGDNNLSAYSSPGSTPVEVSDNDAAGWTPSSTTTYSYPSGAGPVLTNPTTGAADQATKVVVEQPASTGSSTNYSPPADTSHKCYNSQANGNTATNVQLQEEGTSVTISETNNNNGTPIDPIANPQDGAIICNTNPPNTYAIYWNDLGTYQTDDLGYWNAIFTFVCPIPSTTNSGGGAATLSG